jgi:hypothetical protein
MCVAWIIWIVGSILVVITFELGTLAFYVSAGLVFIVGSTMSGGHASTARADVPVTKN